MFLALIGTTLSCLNTGARVTYAMGKDKEVPEHFGMLHAKNLSPHRAIWTLTIISIVIAIIGLSVWAGDAGAPADTAIQALPHGFWSSFGYTTHDKMAALPNTLLTVTLASNFGTFLLYGLSCVICMVGYHNHPNFKPIRHFLIPLFGVVANLVCMAFYLIGPFMGYGTPKEPLIALGIALVWAIYGGIYFLKSSKANGPNNAGREQGGSGVENEVSNGAERGSLRPDWIANMLQSHRGVSFSAARSNLSPGGQPFSGTSMLELEFAQLSDPGKVRGHNEDFIGYAEPGYAGALAQPRLAICAGGWLGRP